VDSSYGRQQQGTGLGLALTKKLIEMHGGRVWVESDGIEGKGSSFVFLMPIKREETKSKAPSGATHPPDEIQRPLVLVLAEDGQHQLLVKNYLVEADYGVALATSADEVSSFLKSKRPYAVVVADQTANQSGVPAPIALPSGMPANIPVVNFSTGLNGKPEFSLRAGDGTLQPPPEAAADGRDPSNRPVHRPRSQERAGHRG
jgi:hypothetical protein